MARVTLALTIAALVAFPAAAGEKEPSAARGRTLFLTTGCMHCHGTGGQGSNSGARLAPDPLPAEAMADFIRTTGGRMPAYGAEILSDQDVADIVAYLATIPAMKSPDDIPLLRDLKPAP